MCGWLREIETDRLAFLKIEWNAHRHRINSTQLQSVVLKFPVDFPLYTIIIISGLSALLVLLLCVSIHVLHILYCNYSKPPNRGDSKNYRPAKTRKSSDIVCRVVANAPNWKNNWNLLFIWVTEVLKLGQHLHRSNYANWKDFSLKTQNFLIKVTTCHSLYSF